MNEKKNERKKEIREKEKNISMCKNKVNSPVLQKCIRKFKASRLKDPYSIFQPCAIR
jgi:hypothetical protein